MMLVSTTNTRIELANLGLSEDKWIQIAYVGSWYYRDGSYFSFDKGLFETLIQNFQRRGSEPIAFKYGHPKSSSEAAWYGAAGWVKDLSVRDDPEGRVSLYALVEWTPRAREMIRDKALKYSSVEIINQSRDNKTDENIGPELVGVAALVDQPFLEGMEPLAASRNADMADDKKLPQELMMARKKKMTDATLLQDAINEAGKDASEEKILKVYRAKKSILEALSEDELNSVVEEIAAAKEEGRAPNLAAKMFLAQWKGAGGSPDLFLEGEMPPGEAPLGGGADDPMMQLGEILQAASGMSTEEFLAKVAENPEGFKAHIEQFLAGEMEISDPAPDPAPDVEAANTITELSRQVRDLSAKDKTRDQTIRDLEVKHKVELALRDGLATEAEKPWLLKLGSQGLLDEDLDRRRQSPPVPTTRTLSRVERDPESSVDWDRSDPVYIHLSKSLAGVDQVLARDPKKLHEATARALHERRGKN